LRFTDDIKEEERTANTGLAKVAVQCSADTFVVKIATFAKPENVSGHAKDEKKPYKTININDIFRIIKQP
jgi:hypothetical protein